jgi:hypothetical protein
MAPLDHHTHLVCHGVDEPPFVAQKGPFVHSQPRLGIDYLDDTAHLVPDDYVGGHTVRPITITRRGIDYAVVLDTRAGNVRVQPGRGQEANDAMQAIG